MNLNIWEWQLFYGMYGNRREERRLRHLARCAEKKEAKRLRAGRIAVCMRNMQPFMRSIASGPTLALEIKVGNDFETYEPEAVKRAREKMEEIKLFLSLDDDFGDS